MEDPRYAHTILIGGFEEQKYKSNTKRIYEHYIKTTWWVTYFPNKKLSKSERGLWSMECFKYGCSFAFKSLNL